MESDTDVKCLTAIKCQIIQEKRLDLVKNINVDLHIDYLRSKFMLTEEDAQEIMHLPTKQKRASLFLDLLFKNGPKAYDSLCQSLLLQRTQIFLLEMLNKEYEKRRNIYKGLMNHKISNDNESDGQTIPLSVDHGALPKPSSVRLSQQEENEEEFEEDDIDIIKITDTNQSFC